MISYAPIEEPVIIQPPKSERRVQEPESEPEPAKHGLILGDEDSECNYLVIFFIVGVFILTINDIMKR